MKNPIKYIAVLFPDAVKNLSPLVGTIISTEGVIRCHKVSQESPLLEIDAAPRDSNHEDMSIRLMIPYSYVSYIVASDPEINKILGFRNDSECTDTQKV